MRRARMIYVLSSLALGSLVGAGCSGSESSPPSAEGSAAGAQATAETAGEPAAATPDAVPEPASEAPAEAPRATARFPAPTAGEQVSVPAGTLLVGSRPGTRSRNPRREADLVSLEVPAFRIDRLPYPNDPSVAPRTQVSRPQAEALCVERGQRLCTELEWERACKADSAAPYVTGERFDASTCRDDFGGCTSPVGVSALGVSVAEWTATPAPRDLRVESATWIARGASSDAEAEEHRCGARHVLDPSAPSLRVGFRCCSGPAPELRYPDHPSTPGHELVEATDDVLTGYLRQMPEVARFAEGFRGTTASAANEVLTLAGKTEEDLAGWRPFTGVLRWSPTEGEHVWVFSGTGGGASLIVVAHPMPDGSLVHGASFVFEGETPPVLVAYSPSTPNALKWSTCWDCAGEGGVIMMRDGRVTIAQR